VYIVGGYDGLRARKSIECCDMHAASHWCAQRVCVQMPRQSCKAGGACGLGAQDTGDSAEFSTDGCGSGVPRAGTRIARVGIRRSATIRAIVAPSLCGLQTLFVCGGCDANECLASATSINTADAGSAWIDLPNMCARAVATDGSIPPQARPARHATLLGTSSGAMRWLSALAAASSCSAVRMAIRHALVSL
jgi:hypothetical protein